MNDQEAQKENQKKSSVLRDVNGKVSSKRVAGFAMLVCTLVVALFSVWRDPASIRDVIWPMCTSTAAMFGVSALERKKL